MRRTSRLVLVVLAAVLLSAATASAAGGYDRRAAATYADTYWQSYNPAWPSFTRKGGDCTNFVSQALYAGGIAMRPSPSYAGAAAWYMLQSKGRRWSYSLSWINVQSQRAFLQSLGATEVASYYGVAPGALVASNAAQGDVVLYDWDDDGVYDHESIVVASDGTNPDGTPNWDLVDAHTNNRYHAYWTLAQYNANWATTHIVVLHIPDTAS
jgi:Putative amidase domain